MNDAALSLREQQAQLTRDLILDAVLERLREGEPGDLAVPEVAKRAGVSLRTVYRYFPTRDELLAAASDRIAELLASSIPETIDELTPAYLASFKEFDREPELVRGMALSRAGRTVRSVRRTRRLEAIRRMVAECTDQLPEEEVRKAEGVLFYLNNMLAWVTLHDEAGLDGRQSAEAITWAMHTLFDDLRARNDAARPT